MRRCRRFDPSVKVHILKERRENHLVRNLSIRKSQLAKRMSERGEIAYLEIRDNVSHRIELFSISISREELGEILPFDTSDTGSRQTCDRTGEVL